MFWSQKEIPINRRIYTEAHFDLVEYFKEMGIRDELIEEVRILLNGRKLMNGYTNREFAQQWMESRIDKFLDNDNYEQMTLKKLGFTDEIAAHLQQFVDNDDETVDSAARFAYVRVITCHGSVPLSAYPIGQWSMFRTESS